MTGKVIVTYYRHASGNTGTVDIRYTSILHRKQLMENIKLRYPNSRIEFSIIPDSELDYSRLIRIESMAGGYRYRDAITHLFSACTAYDLKLIPYAEFRRHSRRKGIALSRFISKGFRPSKKINFMRIGM
jgi:hypothetical protein